MPPRPKALRLVSSALGVRAAAPPFGLRAWSSEAEAIAVLIDAEGVDANDPAAVAAQIPHAIELPECTLVCVLGTAARGRGVIRCVRRAVQIPRSARCTALVARGYVGVGAGIDDAGSNDLAWGFSSPC